MFSSPTSSTKLCEDVSVKNNQGTQKINNIDIVLEEHSEDFLKYFPGIVHDLTTNKEYSDIPEFMERFSKLLEYAVPTGKNFRGILTVITYKMLVKPEYLTPENIKLANVLGWCVQLLEASGVIVDDLMDNAQMRHGAPCWHKNENAGKLVALDAFILENCTYTLLKKYFSSHPFYLPMMELTMDTNLKTGIGETIDNMYVPPDRQTLQMYEAMTKYKTGYYTFLLPVTLGLYLSEAYSEEIHQQCSPILLEMGKFYQIRDDYMDSFGNELELGKDLGRDIREGKRTWLATVALQKADFNQRKVMEEHYGKSDVASVKVVRQLYQELGLPECFLAIAREGFQKVCAEINQVRNVALRNLLQILAEKLYKNETFEVF